MSQGKDIIAAVARLSRMLRRGPVERDSLSHMGFRVLQVIQKHDGVRATEIADLVEVRPASITEALNRLEQDGYVTRVKDAADSRAKRVFVTEKGRAQIQEHALHKQEKNERLLACLTEEEADTFLAVCGKLCDFLEQESDRAPHRDGRI